MDHDLPDPTTLLPQEPPEVTGEVSSPGRRAVRREFVGGTDGLSLHLVDG